MLADLRLRLFEVSRLVDELSASREEVAAVRA
jgi:hypothetical protein